jgi:O-methyltransferase
MAEQKQALSTAATSAWLHLLKKTLIRYPLDHADFEMARELSAVLPAQRQEIERWIEANKHGEIHEGGADLAARAQGKDWPATAETMVGLFRMDDIHFCMLDVLHRKVPGDFAEAGVWRGGVGIMMRALLMAHGERRRNVWLADSFEGCPAPDAKNFPADANDPHWTHPELAVSLEQVKKNFERYGLLDGQVNFLPGWFRDTLPKAPIRKLALLHVDGDMYESTIQILQGLYDKVSPGGYVIIDDYGAVEGCRRAVDDFREQRGISAELKHIDWTEVRWQVSSDKD